MYWPQNYRGYPFYIPGRWFPPAKAGRPGLDLAIGYNWFAEPFADSERCSYSKACMAESLGKAYTTGRINQVAPAKCEARTPQAPPWESRGAGSDRPAFRLLTGGFTAAPDSAPGPEGVHGRSRKLPARAPSPAQTNSAQKSKAPARLPARVGPQQHLPDHREPPVGSNAAAGRTTNATRRHLPDYREPPVAPSPTPTQRAGVLAQ
jgi:hypothetical protein